MLFLRLTLLISFLIKSSTVDCQVRSMIISGNVHDNLCLSDMNDVGIKTVNVSKTEIRKRNKRKTEKTFQKAYDIDLDWKSQSARITLFDVASVCLSGLPHELNNYYFLSSLNEVRLSSNSSCKIEWNDNYQIEHVQIYSDTNFFSLTKDVYNYYSGVKLIGFAVGGAFRKYSLHFIDYSDTLICYYKGTVRSDSPNILSRSDEELEVSDEWLLDIDGNMIDHKVFIKGRLVTQTKIQYQNGHQSQISVFDFRNNTQPFLAFTSQTVELDSLSITTSVTYYRDQFKSRNGELVFQEIPVIQKNIKVNGVLTEVIVNNGLHVSRFIYKNGKLNKALEYETIGTVHSVNIQEETRKYIGNLLESIYFEGENYRTTLINYNYEFN